MAGAPLKPVDEALAHVHAALKPVTAESINLAQAFGRVLAEDVRARVTQPPADVSAMDGYAVIAADVATVPATLRVIGEAPAGGSFPGTLKPGEAVRIFTGGPVPAGADAIVIQEDVERSGDSIAVREDSAAGRHIRRKGLDFKAGDTVLKAGHRLTARDIGLCAAMNVPWLQVRRRPRIALLATGDEVVRPGEPIGPNQIVSSNSFALAALIESRGGVATDLGIAPDSRDALAAMAEGARGADMLVTMGGASVGDRDLVQSVLGEKGLQTEFWRIAMRPGKPLIFGNINGTPMLGLPGNPVSSMICGLLFLGTALHRFLGAEGDALQTETATLGRELPLNDTRRDYMRATLERRGGVLVATPFATQDSSQLSGLSRAHCLVIREPHEPAARAGEPCTILRIDGGGQTL